MYQQDTAPQPSRQSVSQGERAQQPAGARLPEYQGQQFPIAQQPGQVAGQPSQHLHGQSSQGTSQQLPQETGQQIPQGTSQQLPQGTSQQMQPVAGQQGSGFYQSGGGHWGRTNPQQEHQGGTLQSEPSFEQSVTGRQAGTHSGVSQPSPVASPALHGEVGQQTRGRMGQREGQMDPWQTELQPNRHTEQGASTEVQTGSTRGSMSSQVPSEQFSSGSLQSTAAQTSGPVASKEAFQRPGFSMPMVDVVETPDELVVYVDAPGYDKEDIQIHADANTLTVSADRSSKLPFDENEGERGLVVERPTKLERSVPLSLHIDPEEASASFDDGVCIVTIPKTEDEKDREIGFQ